MFKFFEPQGKVQKNREIIRETDTRMAKYSRRGLISNFLVYLLCLVDGQFVESQQKWAIVLTIGLLLTTILRGFFLFRFESIYPHAPARWRNMYFLVTLMGTIWWGLIMSSVTLVLDMQYEAPLLWLYTVVFFSTTAHAFAPYERFLSYYQFIGLVPASACAFFIGDFIGVIYGSVLLFFFWILNHQSHLMADNYWTRLEANYILARKTESLEEEKRDTRASVQLSKDYMSLLQDELKGLLDAKRESRASDDPSRGESSADDRRSNDSADHPLKRPKLLQLYNNVSDFQQIVSKEIVLVPRVFNVRQQVQSLIALYVDEAEAKGIELISILSPALPMRLLGDAERLVQMLQTMLASFIEQSRDEIIFIDLEFIRSPQGGCELNVNLYRQKTSAKKLFFQENQEDQISLDLDLALGIGLADAMGGALEISDARSVASAQLRFTAYFDVPTMCGQLDYYNNFYRGKKLLLVDSSPRVLDIKRQELTTLGLDVTTESDFKKAFMLLEDAMEQGRSYDYLVYHLNENEKQAVGFAGMVNEHKTLKYVSQYLVCSEVTKESQVVKFLLSLPNVNWINKPLGILEFDLVAHSLYSTEGGAQIGKPNAKRDKPLSVLLSGAAAEYDIGDILGRFDFAIQTNTDEKQLAKALSGDITVAVVVVSSSEREMSLLAQIRESERELAKEFYIPIIVVGEEKLEVSAYQNGADYFLKTDSSSRVIEQSVRFWGGVSAQNS